MVSVRSLFEAQLAVHNQADIIDLKEPLEGPLGAVSTPVVRSVLRETPPHVPVGYALGEWIDWRASGELPRVPSGVSYLKVGLSGLVAATSSNADTRIWAEEFRRWRAEVSRICAGPTPIWVAVAYADWRIADAPRPEAVVEMATPEASEDSEGHGFGALLVDTYRKDGSPDALFKWLDEDGVSRLVAAAHLAGLEVALAGALTRDGAETASALGADIVGVRSAVCRDRRRDAPLDPAAIWPLARAVHSGAVAAV